MEIGFFYSAKRLDPEIDEKLGSTPFGRWTEEYKELNQSLILAQWDKLQRWPDAYLKEGLVTADHKMYSSVFRLPMRMLVQHLSNDMKHQGPTIISAGTITEPGDLIRPTHINHILIGRCDLDEIVEVERWDNG